MDVVEAIPKTDVPAALTAALFPGVTAPVGEGAAQAVDPGRFSRELASFVELISPEIAVASEVADSNGNLPVPSVAVTTTPPIPDLQVRFAGTQFADSATPVLLTEAPSAESLPADSTFFLDGFLVAAPISAPAASSVILEEAATADVATDNSADGLDPDKALPSLIAALSTSLLASSLPSSPPLETAAPISDEGSRTPSEFSAPPVELTRFLSRPAFNAPAPAAIAVNQNGSNSDHSPEPPQSDSVAELATQVHVKPLAAVAVPANVTTPNVPDDAPAEEEAQSATGVTAAVGNTGPVTPLPTVLPTPRPTLSTPAESTDTDKTDEPKTTSVKFAAVTVPTTTSAETVRTTKSSETKVDTPDSSAKVQEDSHDGVQSTRDSSPNREHLGALNPAAERSDGKVSATQSPSVSPRDPQQFADRLGRYVLQSHDQGQQLSVRITPPDLGTIVIDVQSGAQGLNVRFETSSVSAQQLLVDQLPRLQDALAQLGRPADRVDVIRTDSGFGPGVGPDTGRGSQQTFADRREQPVPRSPEPVPRSAEREAAPTTVSTPGRMQELNIRV